MRSSYDARAAWSNSVNMPGDELHVVAELMLRIAYTYMQACSRRRELLREMNGHEL